jgi:hypothetical protein
VPTNSKPPALRTVLRPGRRDGLRLVAMVAMGTLRLALDKWKQNDAAHHLAYYLRQGFALLAKQF